VAVYSRFPLTSAQKWTLLKELAHIFTTVVLPAYFRCVAVKAGREWATVATAMSLGESSVNNKEHQKPELVEVDFWFPHPARTAKANARAKETYAEHLALAREYADRSKASLQAHYKSLHAGDVRQVPFSDTEK
jgi:hypothetical protein